MPVPNLVCSRAMQTAPIDGWEVRPDMPTVVSATAFGQAQERILTVDGNVHHIGTSHSTSDHAGSGNTGSVVGVNMDWKVRVLLSDGSNEPEIRMSRCTKLSERELLQGSSLWLQETRHVLDAKNVNALGDELLDEIQVVLESVLGLLRTGNVSTVANNSLADTACLLRSVDTQPHLDIIEESDKHMSNKHHVTNVFWKEK